MKVIQSSSNMPSKPALQSTPDVQEPLIDPSKKHISNFIRSGENGAKLKPRIGWHTIYKWYTQLAAFQKAHLEQMRFGKFFSIIPFNLDQGLIDASTERWRGETNSYNFGCAEMVLALEDMVHLMGLPVDGVAMFLERSSSYRRGMGRLRQLSRPE